MEILLQKHIMKYPLFDVLTNQSAEVLLFFLKSPNREPNFPKRVIGGQSGKYNRLGNKTRKPQADTQNYYIGNTEEIQEMGSRDILHLRMFT